MAQPLAALADADARARTAAVRGDCARGTANELCERGNEAAAGLYARAASVAMSNATRLAPDCLRLSALACAPSDNDLQSRASGRQLPNFARWGF